MIFQQHKTGSEELSVTYFTCFRDTAGVKKIAVSVRLSEGMGAIECFEKSQLLKNPSF